MTECRDYIALDWVAGEIKETLKEASQSLEAYIANRDDVTKLRFCLTHIHQVHGTLKMVEFFGAALLAEEMETLVEALSQGRVHDSHVDDALSVLQQAIAQLPVYIERVKESRHGLPATLLPVLNDLRAVRGESLLSETVLFSPDLSAQQSQQPAGELVISGSELAEVSHKLRQMFQIALLGLIRGKDVRKNLNYLAKVCARLAKLSSGRPPQELWRVCIAVLEGLLNGSIESSVAVKILLRQVDREIKKIIDGGDAALEQAPPADLFKNLLYYVARSKANSKFIKQIKEEYKLGASILGEGELDAENMVAPDGAAMRSVVEALAQELRDINTGLNQAGTDGATLAAILPQFRRVSDTMAMLGIGNGLKLFHEQHTALAKYLSASDNISPEQLQLIIDNVASIESELSPVSMAEEIPAERELFNDSEEAQEQLDGAFDSVVRESRNGLEQAKEAIIEFVATQWNHNCLSDVPDLLSEIHGSLAIVPLTRAAEILQACEHYIREVLLSKRTVPEWQMLDTLADAITSVDYYLERIIDGADYDADSGAILDVAAESVAELGFPVATPTSHIKEEEPLAVDPGQDLEIPVLEEPSAEEESSADEVQFSSEAEQEPEGADEQPVLEESFEPEPVLAEVIPIQPAVAAEEPEITLELNSTEEITSAAEQEEEDEDYDPEIVEIFIEEAAEVLETINEFFPVWRLASSDEEARTTIRRSFHTLKGSGRMVGAEDIGELAWAIENMLNRVIDGTVNIDELRFELISDTLALVPDMVSSFEQRKKFDMTEPSLLIARAEALAAEQSPDLSALIPAEEVPSLGESLPEEALLEDESPEEASVVEDIPVPILDEGLLQEPANEIPEEQAVLEDFVAVLSEDASTVAEDAEDEVDTELLEIFAGEAITHTQVLDDFIGYCKTVNGLTELSDELQRALHTLKGSANMAGVVPVAMVVTPVEHLVKELRASQLKADQAVVGSLEQASQLIKVGIGQLQTTPMQLLPGAENFIDCLANLHKEKMAQAADDSAEESSIPPEALNTFLTTSLDKITDVTNKLGRWLIDDLDSPQKKSLATSISTFVDHAERVNMIAPVELGQALQALYRQAADLPRDPGKAFFSLAERANDGLIDMLDQVAGHQNPAYEPKLLAAIEEFEFPAIETAELIDFGQLPEVEGEFEIVDPGAADDAPALVDAEEPVISLAPEPAPTSFEASPDSVVDASDDDEVDAEILEIFLEEADDLLESIDEAIHNWSDNRESREYLDDLQRILHTLKGGARLTNSIALGDLSHNFETFLIEAEAANTKVDDDFFARVQDYQDQLITSVEAVKRGDKSAPMEEPAAEAASLEPVPDNVITLTESEVPAGLDEQTDNIPTLEPVAEQPDTPVEEVSAEDVLDEPGISPAKTVSPFTAPVAKEKEVPAASVEDNKRSAPQEVIKVSAGLLENLVNLAGETSISRGRAEEQISELVFSLEEMQITVDRLQEQVRRLDMETEQQILYRQEQVESEGLEGFDPLEMDRYSQLQQLSRSLLESSSDLIDIKGTLADKSRDMETLLIQQSRINTELQEGLMRSRMVPFSRMVPRLRRIIRQVSGELDKKVDFRLENVEGELDRSVLERMVAPLEHMLRNAVDHGIETVRDRVSAGKPKKGTVSLGLSREGGEIVITLTDDGAGIDLQTVRSKAIERGLMDATVNLSDHEVLQFILQAGFSTATEVTQISGRGVGMDVVHSEIKQLGGSMDIESVFGQGSRFIVRLPFTVSVNRALMVSVSGDSYAIPLNTIEGIVRVSPFELEAYYQPDAPLFEYAGQPYLLRYMGALLKRGEKPNLEGHMLPLPVILVRGADHSVAVQVDSLLGSREIVVKPLGPQFSMVQGLTGATVLGDGNVVVILDLLAMLRADASHLHQDGIAYDEYAREEERSTLVMVVDDSVTVRKVTSHFLERQGMDVLLAKDGVDAMTQLQEIDQIPDVMLLDIEMPRMDGFEVASRVRHTSRLKDIPIIMITSRTGDKHRERALSLGVSKYMGKPYQEAELLETIEELTGTTVR